MSMTMIRREPDYSANMIYPAQRLAIGEIVRKLVLSELDREDEEKAGAIRRDGGRWIAIDSAVDKIAEVFSNQVTDDAKG